MEKKNSQIAYQTTSGMRQCDLRLAIEVLDKVHNPHISMSPSELRSSMSAITTPRLNFSETGGDNQNT
jgi:hypothetical protein